VLVGARAVAEHLVTEKQGSQPVDPNGDGAATAADGGMVAASLLGEKALAVRGGVLETGGCGIGVAGAHLSVKCEDLEVGECGSALLLGERVWPLELLEHGHKLGLEPVLLAVGAQQ
jgi:hypothetical protein